MTHETHAELPSGFSYADRLQVESFMQSGSIDGASKVCLVAGTGELPRLATRLRPPMGDPAYKVDYCDGWAAGKRQAYDKEGLSHGYSDGYRDASENRMKWHLAYCASHGDHAHGCQS